MSHFDERNCIQSKTVENLLTGGNSKDDWSETIESPSMNIKIDYDQDIISAQDVESGKDITDITDVEKDEGGEEKRTCKSNCLNSNYKKKKFAGEEIDEEMQCDTHKSETSDKRKVIEKSPKERFARFDEELGAGAIKRVFRGYDYDTGREIAWNVVNVSCMSEEAISKVQEEIAIIKKLKHANIINFVSGFFNEEKKEVVIITEIFNSGSLKQYLNRIKHPRLKVVKYWCKEILKGLKYLHELPNPIIHRDIKCDNVFINSTTSEIKLGDLGYSCILSNRDYAKSVSGTPEFMAPEVLEGKYGVLADIYSFGICVLEIVTREKPYKECENNIIDIFENIKNHKLPKSIEKIKNARLLEFIKSLLKSESERPSASQLLMCEFLNDLDHEENNSPALMYPLQHNPQSDIHLDKNNFAIVEINKHSKSNKELSPNIRDNRDKVKGNQEIIKLNLCQPNTQDYASNKNGSQHISLNQENNKLKTKLTKFNDIVGLRHKKAVPVLLNLNKNTVKNENLPYESSSDEEVLDNIKSKEDKYNYDPCLIKSSDLAYYRANFNSTLGGRRDSAKIFTPYIKPAAKPVSKIEIKIEEEYKEQNALKISLVKKDKPKCKGQKISFVFDLKNDTCEKIVKELEIEKIGLNDEENKFFVEKLSNLIHKHSVMSKKEIITKNSDPISEEHDVATKEDHEAGKVLLEKFFKKHSKIVAQAEEILKLSHPICEEIIKSSTKNSNLTNISQFEKDFLEKRKVLEEFLRLCH
jgi:WNK lysine deficient protein kinase